MTVTHVHEHSGPPLTGKILKSYYFNFCGLSVPYLNPLGGGQGLAVGTQVVPVTCIVIFLIIGVSPTCGLAPHTDTRAIPIILYLCSLY